MVGLGVGGWGRDWEDAESVSECESGAIAAAATVEMAVAAQAVSLGACE